MVEMKAAYALGFLGLCAFVLVLHVYDAPAEDVKEVEDPFLASLEKVGTMCVDCLLP